MPRRIFRLALLAAALLALIAPRALADESSVTIDSVSSSPTQVSITGTLRASGAAVKRQELVALIDGAEIGRGSSRGNGTFTISAALPSPLSEGTHAVLVRFNGGDGHGPSAASAELSVGATGSGAGPTGITSAPAAPTLRLRATAPEKAVNGEVIELSGRVVDAAGAGVGGAVISVRDDSGDVADSSTVTDGDGRFTTWYSIPSQQGDGELSLILAARGAGTDKVTLGVAITHTDVPEEDPATLSPSPTPSPTPSVGSDAAAPLLPTPSAVPTAGPTEERSDGGALFWPLAALLAVAAIAVICIGLLIARVRRGHAAHRLDSELTFFLDEDESLVGRHEEGNAEPNAAASAPRRALPTP